MISRLKLLSNALERLRSVVGEPESIGPNHAEASPQERAGRLRVLSRRMVWGALSVLVGIGGLVVWDAFIANSSVTTHANPIATLPLDPPIVVESVIPTIPVPESPIQRLQVLQGQGPEAHTASQSSPPVSFPANRSGHSVSIAQPQSGSKKSFESRQPGSIPKDGLSASSSSHHGESVRTSGQLRTGARRAQSPTAPAASKTRNRSTSTGKRVDKPRSRGRRPAATRSRRFIAEYKGRPSTDVAGRPHSRVHATIPTRRAKSVSAVVRHRVKQARQFIERQQFERALTVLAPIDSSFSSWTLWFWRGTALLGLGRLDEAESAFAEGLRLDDSVPSLWVHRALVSQQFGNHARALEYLRQAELLAPDLPEVLLNLGYSLEAEGFVPLATEYYRRFLVSTQGLPRYRNVRITVRQRLALLAPRLRAYPVP